MLTRELFAVANLANQCLLRRIFIRVSLYCSFGFFCVAFFSWLFWLGCEYQYK